MCNDVKVKVILIQEKTSVVLERLKQLEPTLWIQSILAQYVPSHLNVKVGSSSICSLTVEKSPFVAMSAVTSVQKQVT